MGNKPLVHYCMACGKIKIDDSWFLVGAESLADYRLSHGYCDPCAEKAIAEAERQIIESKRANRPAYKLKCIRCGESEYWYKLKKGLCTYCQSCDLCGKEDCEKEFNHSLAITICLECGESVIDREDRKQKTMEVLC